MLLDFLRSVLILIDIQYDFCPGGTLAVEKGDLVIEPANRLSSLFKKRGGFVAATQDWHPEGHISFASSHKNKKPGDFINLPSVKNQILWPGHCIQGSRGADLHDNLDLNPITIIIRKGYREDLDSYSAFFENDRKTHTGLDGYLKAMSIETILLAGLATDYCVFYSAMDAKALGYKTIIAEDAVRGVDIPKGSLNKALRAFNEAGIALVLSGDIE
jgi:nicotinamidase/pyrazinamidase